MTNKPREFMPHESDNSYIAVEYRKLKAENEALKEQVDFLKMYYNPKDTSFQTMVETFIELSDEQKQALINLTEALLKTKDAK